MDYMWESQTDILFRTEVNSTKRQYLAKLIDLFSIPIRGVLIILDSDDYKKHPNPRWTYQGLHLNIKMGGIEEMSPEYLLEIMESRKYSNLIWLSKRICDANLIEFIWVASHEFQHFIQDQNCHILSVANAFLNDNLSHPGIRIEEPKVPLTVPYEFDAEIEAYKTVKKLLGDKQAHDFIKDSKNYDRLKRLHNHDFSKPYNVLTETIHFFEKYQDELIKYVDSTEVPFVNSFDIKKTISDLKECT